MTAHILQNKTVIENHTASPQPTWYLPKNPNNRLKCKKMTQDNVKDATKLKSNNPYCVIEFQSRQNPAEQSAITRCEIDM